MGSRRLVSGIVGVTLAATSASWVGAEAAHTAAPQASAVPDKIDRSLGNGLGRLLAEPAGAPARRRAGGRFDREALTIRDEQGRVLVDLTPRAGVDRAAFGRRAQALGLVVQAVDRQHGTLEGFVPLSAVRRLASMPGTGTLAQALKPQTRVGAATSQGVRLQRVDRVQRRGVDGRGITIAALSDSYDTAVTDIPGNPLTIHAADDVASGDLPGTGNPRNPNPVRVLEDGPAGDGTDEGRAMLQIAHDVAPGAKLCFATAFTGLVGFTANVRRLADKSGLCGADVIVDDVGYLDEPMFSDSVLSDAIDDVAARGVHYFSSAGNDGEQQSWASRVRLVPAVQGAQSSNLDLTGVDPALYDGGLQDMAPGSLVDVAQNLTFGPDGGLVNLQWDDPVDVDGATFGAPFFEATGEITDAAPEASFDFTATGDQVGGKVQFRTDAIPSGTTDLILSVTAPDGSSLGTIDTGASPEVLSAVLPEAGTYTITISGFDGDSGDFTLDVRPVLSPSAVSTDFNALFFDPEGGFLGAIADLNTLSGRPSEIGGLADFPQVQMVIARAGTGPLGATRLRNVLSGDAYLTEYAEPLAPAVFGHAAARGATAVAAYDPFRPFLPEPYTSPGGLLQVFFDSAGNRLARPQTRRVPQVAAADRGNTTFFVADDLRDADTLPNFGGTSASAPHAAAIAALVADRAGGPRVLTPAAMRRRLQRTTFAHDLDPAHSAGRAWGLTASANGAQGREVDLVPGPMNDPRFFRLRYTGRVPLRSVTFYGATASPTARGVRRGSAGIVFDPRPFDPAGPFRQVGFPFTVGATTGGLRAGTVSASFSRPAGTPSVAGQYRRMKVSFARGLRRGQSVRFGVDRDLAVSGFGGSNEGNGADELGGAVLLPRGTRVTSGMAFTAARADGRVFRGEFRNRLGKGYTPVDGFGVVDAQRAVFGR